MTNNEHNAVEENQEVEYNEQMLQSGHNARKDGEHDIIHFSWSHKYQSMQISIVTQTSC